MIERDIVLMGLRGSGKSTVGRLLADLLGRTFVDLDDRTLAIFQRTDDEFTIAQVFEQFGESRFREAETQALREELETERDPIVFALGGGTPTAPGASDLLKESGAALVYLRSVPNRLAKRLSGEIDHRRPALTDIGDPIAEIADVYKARDGLYCSLADIVFEDDLGAEQTAAELMRRLEEMDLG